MVRQVFHRGPAVSAPMVEGKTAGPGDGDVVLAKDGREGRGGVPCDPDPEGRPGVRALSTSSIVVRSATTSTGFKPNMSLS